MPIRSDYHLHSHHSGDCKEPMENIIKHAIQMNLESICFTEHMDIDYPLSEHEPFNRFILDVSKYEKEFLHLKEHYKNQIDLFFGVELGLQSHLSKELYDFCSQHSFDFIIGSSHVCNGYDPYYDVIYKDYSEDDAYALYFSSILDNLGVFHDFDVYGHLDYVVRYGPTKDSNYSYEKYKDQLDSILTKLIDLGIGIEVNAAGLARGLKGPNPCFDIIKRYKKLGGEIITIGSDAHVATDLCQHFKTVEQLIKEAGFDYYNTFSNRKPLYHSI